MKRPGGVSLPPSRLFPQLGLPSSQVGACSALSGGVLGSQRGRARFTGGRGFPNIICEGVYFLLTFSQ